MFSGSSLGYRIQGGVNLYKSKLVTFQGLLGGEYADVTNKGLDMNYSGFLISLNIIFNK